MRTPQQDQFLAALKTAYVELFDTDPGYAYSASKYTGAQMAEKMFAATLARSANTTGAGFSIACKICGIAHTGKAIDAFLGVAAPAKVAKPSPRARKVLVIGLSNIEAMMSGVARIQRAHELVTLHYTDGKTESGLIKNADWLAICEKPFVIVSAVQSQRQPATA